MISTNRYSTSYQYDLRGNITNLDRNDVLSPSNCSSHEKIDDLSYSYNSNDANRLHDINDTAPGLGNNAGFKNGNGNYTYDSNGNITYDPYKKISIAYNHLDKPTQISYFSKRGSARCIRFKYDADGNRLQKSLHIDELELERRDYIAGFEYLAGNIESIMHSEGRISIANGHAKYEYTFKDHLGNTRLVYSDLNLDGIINVNTEILQESHYYPFGMEMNGSYIQNTNTDYRYKYNGIERLKDFDIGVDFAYYRVLDPVIGRWWQVDPKGELGYHMSPYNSMGNSPISYADPEGDIAFVPILLGAAIGAGVSGATTIATNAIAGNNLFQGFGKAVAMGAVGGANGAGKSGAFTGSAFGQSTGFGILNNVASNAATSAAFGQDITLGSLAGSVAGGFVAGQIPGFTGVKGGGFANAFAEIGYKAGTGAITGAVGGGIGAAIDRGNVGDGILNGAKYGAIGGGVQAGLNILTMGPTYKPDRDYGNFGKHKPVYRTGTFITRALSGPGSGIALGRNLVTHQMKDWDAALYGVDKDKFNHFLRAHETAHFDQQRRMGFGRFYGRTAGEYLRYGLKHVYGTPGTLEYQADMYAQRLLGYKY